MKIIIATQNQDKFKIVKSLLNSTLFLNAEYYSLKDLLIKNQSEESGSLMNRAEQKALFAYPLIKEKLIEFDFIVGADDGMKLEGKGTDVNSKEITEDILNNNLLKVGEQMNIVRGFAIVNSDGEIIESFETEIPFRFIGNPKRITSQEFKYPLNYVLSPLNMNISLMDLGEDECLNYYVKYSKAILEDKVNKILLKK